MVNQLSSIGLFFLLNLCLLFFVAETCSDANHCAEGSFCNVDNVKNTGVCVECYSHSHLCFENNLTDDGIDSCFKACYSPFCEQYDEVVLTVDGSNIPSYHILGIDLDNVTGTLVEGSIGYTPDAICLIERGKTNIFNEWGCVNLNDDVSDCKNSGGIGAIIYNNEPGELYGYMEGDNATAIPSVTISMEDGIELSNNGIGSDSSIDFLHYEFCRDECSDKIPCPDNHYCNFDFETYGYCELCDGDSQCYFSGLPLFGAKDCAATCGSSLSFDDCKLCEGAITGNAIGTAASEADTCSFCPSGLQPSYEDVIVPMFGEGTSCFLVDEFFRNYIISASDTNCKLGLMYNHLCGCGGGTGYAGANTSVKRIAFVWLPRCTAILSAIGSLIIIVDIARDKEKCSKMKNQMMVALSIFDLVGSVAYSLTSLPAPETDGVHGSAGNEATCTAQGYFIQLGATAAYLNVSLSIYYLLVIRFGWSERRVRRYRAVFFLFPITVGLAFAFAGIPFYTNMILWCNNGARWWPEIPVITSIIVVTIIMVIICIHVHREEQASKRWRQNGNDITPTNRMSKAVFWQSFWYLMVFYLTWPPYLALQYLWSSGRAFSLYNFTLLAGAVVPMQGFWNCVVFKRRGIQNTFSRIYSNMNTSKFSSSILPSKTTPSSTTLNKESTNAPPSEIHVSANEKDQDSFDENAICESNVDM